jgi:ADP-heptose:LPS heptosyltransferase
MTDKKPWACVSRMGGIGDNLMAAAVLPGMAQKYRIDMLTNTFYGLLFDNNPWVEKVTKVRNEDIPTTSMPEWQSWFAKRAREYEFFANLSHSCEALVAIPQSQTPFYWSSEWRRKHCGKNYLEVIAEICGIDPVFDQPLFYPTEAEIEEAVETKAKIGQHCIGWCVAGSRLDKYHPYTPIIVARLIRELGIPVLMFGAGQREMEVVKQTMEHLGRHNGNVIGLHEARTCYEEDGKTIATNASGKEIYWPIRRSITQLMHCDLIIGPDTGMAWGAAFEDVPKIVLLSHASPENITKHWKRTIALHANREAVDCWPCHQLHDTIEFCRANKDITGAACISDISAEIIVDTAHTLLSGQPINDLTQRLGPRCTVFPGSFPSELPLSSPLESAKWEVTEPANGEV